jgi:hypothetical protein
MTNLSHRQRGDSEFVCPKCRSGNIYELSLCVVIHRIRQWNDAGIPEDYESPEVDWESDMPYDLLLKSPRKAPVLTFECGECMAQFEHPKRAEGSEGKLPPTRPLS